MPHLLGRLVAALSPSRRNSALRELLDYDEPLLRELMTAAPGTFQHSVNVGVLADAAAKSIRRHALLARIGALYHDVGKMRAPTFFVENQRGGNPHDRLDPEESARILKAHVSDGIDMVRSYQLDSRIVDFVREHHGTSFMRPFQAKAEARGLPASGELFRYAGPRPRSPETGIVMIADQLEATGRSTPPATEPEAYLMVGETLARIRAEDQLSEAQLSRRDLQTIHVSMARALHAMHHSRMSYPPAGTTFRSPLAGVKAALRRRRAG